MKSRYLIACGLCAAVFAAGVALAPAQAKTMKECAAEWDKMKAAKQTGGMKYRDFSKQCMAGTAAAPAAPTASANDCCASAGRDARARNHDGEAGDGFGRPPGHDRPRARVRRGVESRQGGRENPGRNEMAAILERLRQAQEGARDVRCGSLEAQSLQAALDAISATTLDRCVVKCKGRLAQRKSTSLTWKGSEVRSLYRPPVLILTVQYTALPPEISNTAPVENEHSSEASHATSAAISSTSTKRFIGIFDSM